MSEKSPYNQKAREAITLALETFINLSKALGSKIHALGKKFDKGDLDPGQLTKDIVAHMGAWRMVQDALKKFGEKDRELGGVGEDGIDFGKAREEIRRRIARLVPKRSD